MSERADIAIVGGGLTGATLALALHRAGSGARIALFDGEAARGPSRDIRAYAIAAGTRRMLEELGIWQRVEADAEPVSGIDLTDAQAAEAIRPVLLSFADEARAGEPMAHFVMARRLVDETVAALAEAGVEPQRGARLTGLAVEPGAARLRTTAGEAEALAVIGADGARSAVRRLADIGEVRFGYAQSALVAVLSSDVPHGGRAVQHFRPGGPLALLPLSQDRRGLVWSLAGTEAARLSQLPVDQFAEAVMAAAGPEAGELAVLEGPFGHPLELAVARSFARHRVALVGDAAHRVHPLAGQGLNLGYRDIAALAEVLVEALRRGEDVGSLAVLRRYERWRRFDTVEFAAATDTLNRLFAPDWGPLRLLRGAGLTLVDRMGGLKRRFVGEAAGEAGRLPRLMAGESL